MSKKYKVKVENHLPKTIKIVRSDRGGEYDSTPLAEYCALNDLVHQIMALNTPQQNVVVERNNRTLKENGKRYVK